MLANHVVCSHIRSHEDATPEEKAKKPKTNQTSHMQLISGWAANSGCGVITLVPSVDNVLRWEMETVQRWGHSFVG